ncbi:sensor histidine kinase [Pseudaestuariivita rosea]|uniref:sensor histidine kinase n=1 Tax=Pseudaestuariivita rosea TaxID=2763263 RepID=UPI001ABA50D7|nr:sensor histidine kinase [Pseudaestuariivita rosea]
MKGSLALRLLILLTAVLLPLGLIAVYQTGQIVGEARLLSERVLLSMTERAVANERRMLSRAMGTTRGLVSALVARPNDPDYCNELMQQVVRNDDLYVFAGHIAADGIMRCSSRDAIVDFSDFDDFKRIAAAPEPMITFNPNGAVTGQSVIIVNSPLMVDGQFEGIVSISMPHEIVRNETDFPEDDLRLATFSPTGILLSFNSSNGSIEDLFPQDVSVLDIIGQERASFTDTDVNGQRRQYAVVPVVPGEAYAIGIWQDGAAAAFARPSYIMLALFPVVMLFASLTVAYFGIHRLVLRHVDRLYRTMRSYTIDPDVAVPVTLDRAAAELEQVGLAYNRMLQTLQAKQAEQEEDLKQKTILLREVHHRVKNNLQMIASIMNMQMRATKSDEVRQVLKRLHERVLGLSTIHRNLYTTAEMSTVAADHLISEIVDHVMTVGVDTNADIAIEKRLDAVLLYPDQAVPLSLLVSEALANAVKYLGKPSDGSARLSVSLAHDPSDQSVRLMIENSKGDQMTDEVATDASDGLGTRLISAFVDQIDGTSQVVQDEKAYRIVVDFHVQEFTAEENEKETRADPDA